MPPSQLHILLFSSLPPLLCSGSDNEETTRYFSSMKDHVTLTPSSRVTVLMLGPELSHSGKDSPRPCVIFRSNPILQWTSFPHSKQLYRAPGKRSKGDYVLKGNDRNEENLLLFFCIDKA